MLQNILEDWKFSALAFDKKILHLIHENENKIIQRAH